MIAAVYERTSMTMKDMKFLQWAVRPPEGAPIPALCNMNGHGVVGKMCLL